MSKRATFPRRKNDTYDTPPEAVLPLLEHIPTHYLPVHRKTFAEPCAGRGDLVKALAGHMRCVYAGDIAPRADWITKQAAGRWQAINTDFIITNPPWTRQVLHPMIERFRVMCPTWLLFDADWMHTKQAAPYLPYCHKVVSVGRVKWIPDSPHTGKDNAAWYLFDRDECQTEFVGRSA
jgi:hypothetical protein